ncbi:beta-N-acetylhexosaminidase [Akkermansia glycaniphila]|uniref:beta-N-acetylhexosaminidase n=1 Tax=Akkermansia glycaniphila TaxID=1679444 RepID=A0A1H6LV25_9BACT|nr:beta-N-acetylhexosaminidase [Akkermansia glycaniphila]SEH88889.1 beta-hexosaminidase [Akkermansia glycaniphila]
MKMKKFVCLIVCSAFSMGSAWSADLDLIPLPRQVELAQGTLSLGSDTSIGFSSLDCQEPGLYFAEKLRQGTGWQVPVLEDWSKARIRLIVDPASFTNSEEYKLSITQEHADVAAATPQALASGLQTLLQMMPPDIYAQGTKSSIVLPCATINDFPEIGHRGISFDVARYFQDKATILKLLEGLAASKINSFQWHLTDDQGWRFPSKAYPKLTQSGSAYTEDDIKEIVQRARQLGIRIIPEIDMPGHSAAAIKAYPELGTKRENSNISNVLNVGKPEVYTFAETIVKEVNELIPGTYFHMGADEVARGVWKNDPDCIKLMEKEGLKNVNELQAYFTRRIASILRKHGRKPLAWDEAMDGGLGEDKDIGIVAWRGTQFGLKPLDAGHPVMWTPGSRIYFDKVNSRNKKEPRGYGNHVLPLYMVYSYCPMPTFLPPEQQKLVMGAQAGLWAEVIHSPDQMFELVFPRISALGEALWMPREKKDWDSYLKRLETMKKRYDAMGIPYFWDEKSMPVTIGSWEPKQVAAPRTKLTYRLNPEQVSRSGYHEINAEYAFGEGTVVIHSMEWSDASGKIVSKDVHDYTSTFSPRNTAEHYYYLNADAPGEYSLTITLSPVGTGSCHGWVQMIRPLPSEETAPVYDLQSEKNRNKQPKE